MILARGRCLAVSCLLAASAVLGAFAQDAEDWSNSPEAYFLTREERSEWKTLDSRDSRHAFIERYWLKRDPTPGTAKNEFQEMVLARIRTADARFGIAKTLGSRTARGFVYVIFGSPARIQESHAPLPQPPRIPQPGETRNPVGAVEGTETTSVWIYDRERTLAVLEAIGRPGLEVTFVLEPNRRIDRLQNPGLFSEYREMLAKKSIVNPDLVAPNNVAVEGKSPDPLPHHALSEEIRSLLDGAPASSRLPEGEGPVFGNAILWKASGAPDTLVWFFLPSPGKEITFHALIRRAQDGQPVSAISEPAAASSLFSSVTPGVVVLRRLALPPGDYAGAFAVVIEGASRRAWAASASLKVPDPDRSFSVSSLILTRGPGAADPYPADPFSIGGVRLPPRADGVFVQNESVWYFFEAASRADPKEVTLEVQLRRDGAQVGSLAPFPARLQAIGAGRYLAGFEMPLSSLSPGDYVLYVTVRDGSAPANKSVLRRADFRLVPEGRSPRGDARPTPIFR